MGAAYRGREGPDPAGPCLQGRLFSHNPKCKDKLEGFKQGNDLWDLS